MAQWLSVVPECGINTSTKTISDLLNDIQLDEDEEIVSFDVSSLYTNVPVMEAINVCADLLYNGSNEQTPVDKATFIQLAKLSSCDVIMSTHAGYYKQVDGLAMGSPPASHLANGWMSQFDDQIKGNAKLFARYMDDILRNIKRQHIENILHELNNIHPALKFTSECEQNGKERALKRPSRSWRRTNTLLHFKNQLSKIHCLTLSQKKEATKQLIPSRITLRMRTLNLQLTNT